MPRHGFIKAFNEVPRKVVQDHETIQQRKVTSLRETVEEEDSMNIMQRERLRKHKKYSIHAFHFKELFCVKTCSLSFFIHECS